MLRSSEREKEELPADESGFASLLGESLLMSFSLLIGPPMNDGERRRKGRWDDDVVCGSTRFSSYLTNDDAKGVHLSKQITVSPANKEKFTTRAWNLYTEDSEYCLHVGENAWDTTETKLTDNGHTETLESDQRHYVTLLKRPTLNDPFVQHTRSAWRKVPEFAQFNEAKMISSLIKTDRLPRQAISELFNLITSNEEDLSLFQAFEDKHIRPGPVAIDFDHAIVNKNLLAAQIEGAIAKLQGMNVVVTLPNKANALESAEATGFDTIIGLSDLKKKLMQELDCSFGSLRGPMRELTKITRPKELDNYNRLLLFTGKPGTGKTAIASQCAEHYDVPLVEVAAHNFKSKWLGETEKQIHEIFSTIDVLSIGRRLSGGKGGVLMFMDEVDSVLGSRESAGSDSIGNSILTSFLTKISAPKLDSIRVLACATNMPSNLDPAFLSRAKIINFPVPDLEYRQEFFQDQARHLSAEDTRELANLSEGMVPRDILEILASAERSFLQYLSDQGKPVEKGPSLEFYVDSITTRHEQITSTYKSDALTHALVG